MFLAYLYHYRTASFERFCRRYFWYMLVAGFWLWVPAFLFALRDTPFIYSVGFTQIYVGAGLIISALVVRGVPSNWLTRSIGYVGVYSYSIYLWHLPLRSWGLRAVWDAFGVEPPKGWVGFWLYLVGCILLGILFARLIEFPVLRLRDRLFPSRSQDLPPSKLPVAPPIGVKGAGGDAP